MLLYAKVQLEIGKAGNFRYSDVFCDNFGTQADVLISGEK